MAYSTPTAQKQRKGNEDKAGYDSFFQNVVFSLVKIFTKLHINQFDYLKITQWENNRKLLQVSELYIYNCIECFYFFTHRKALSKQIIPNFARLKRILKNLR
jgi:hypothetical protein